MTRVKVCGLMNKKDIDLCVNAGVHMLGFVVDYPDPVPWNLSTAEARELIRAVPAFVSTCVVTGGSAEKILQLAREVGPNVVQLHYKETLQEVKEIAEELKLRGIRTIKALRIDGEGNCDFEIANPVLAARALAKTGVAAILVDAYTAAMPGGTGVRVDLSTFLTIQQERTVPVILAGGLSPTNIAQAIRESKPYAVDTLTGIEESSGRKDPEKIISFMQGVCAFTTHCKEKGEDDD